MPQHVVGNGDRAVAWCIFVGNMYSEGGLAGDDGCSIFFHHLTRVPVGALFLRRTGPFRCRPRISQHSPDPDTPPQRLGTGISVFWPSVSTRGASLFSQTPTPQCRKVRRPKSIRVARIAAKTTRSTNPAGKSASGDAVRNALATLIHTLQVDLYRTEKIVAPSGRPTVIGWLTLDEELRSFKSCVLHTLTK